MFDHVQRMPIAFFTRTRTGALVSRLNNDVIGAQRAFSDTLSGVVSNIVMLVLTVIVMLGLSWQITLIALLLLPVFVYPARRMGTRLARLEREAANHNAVMSTQMTERFSAPGATLVKLFGRPAVESAEFAARATRVRDIGVRTAMVQAIFVTALTLVSALALAVVYGLGGFYALRKASSTPGSVVALALLLTRLYVPLTALASARVEVMIGAGQLRAGLRGARPRAADQGEAGCADGAGGAGLGRVRRRPLRLPVGRQGLAGLARGGGDPRHPRRRRGAARRLVPGRARARSSRWSDRPVRASRRSPSSCRGCTTPTAASVRLSGVDVRDLTADSIRDTLGMVTQDGHLFHESVRANLLLAQPEATEDEIWEVLRPREAGRPGRVAARPARHRRRRARLPAVRAASGSG